MQNVGIIPIPDSDNSTYLTLLELAFRIYFEEGLVKSQQEFSTRILGMGPSYFSCMRARKRTPASAVLERLLKQTRLFLVSCERNPYFGKTYSIRLNQTYDRLDGLADTLEDELLIWEISPIMEFKTNKMRELPETKNG